MRTILSKALRRWARTTPEGLGLYEAYATLETLRAARADRARPGSWTYANGNVPKIAAALVSGRGDALGAAFAGACGGQQPVDLRFAEIFRQRPAQLGCVDQPGWVVLTLPLGLQETEKLPQGRQPPCHSTWGQASAS